MNIKKIMTGAAAVALSSAMITPAFALSVGGVVKTATDVNTSASSTNGLKTGVTKIVNDLTTGVGGSADVNANAHYNGNGNGANANVDASGNANENASSDTGVILITRDDINAALSGSANVHSNAVKNGVVSGNASATGSAEANANAQGNGLLDLNFSGTPSSVHSNADLSAFIASQIKADDAIQQVQASTDNVAVTFKDAAKFLGFIPVSIDATAIVDASGNVAVDYPWYSFLFVKHDAELQTKIESRVNDILQNAGLSANSNGSLNGRVKSALGASATGTAQASAHADTNAQANADANAALNGTLTAQDQATLIANIQAAIQEELNAAASANASGSASVNQ